MAAAKKEIGSLRLVGRDEGLAAHPPSVPEQTKEELDRQLVNGLRAAAPGAARQFYERVRPQVDKTLRRLVGRGDFEFDDAVQGTMLELIQTIDRFRFDCSLDSWVSTVAAHVVYKRLRRRSLERRFFDTHDASPHDNVVGLWPHPKRNAMLNETLRKLGQLLSAMDEKKVWTFLLHDVWGYDLKEIAQITEVSVAAAQSRLVRARNEIQRTVAEDPSLANAFAEMGEGT